MDFQITEIFQEFNPSRTIVSLEGSEKLKFKNDSCPNINQALEQILSLTL